MSHRAIAEQALVEHQLLHHITAALRITLDWHYRGHEASRRLSSLVFIAQSLRRHVERLLAFDDDPEYVAVLVELHPHLRGQLPDLRQQHAAFREELADTVDQLEEARPEDQITVGNLCEDLRALVRAVEQYSHDEMALLKAYIAS